MRRAALLAAVALAASPAGAKDKPPVFVQSAPVKDKPTVALDAAKAYVLLRTSLATPLYLMKVPSAQDQAAYDKLRANAFAEARAKYARKLKDYDTQVAMAKRTPGLVAPDKPVEPTEANFEFTSFGILAHVEIGPLNRFAKSKELSTYLQALTPGSYRVYGLIGLGANGAMVGQCFCMGSVKFEARAGEIVDLGVIGANAPPQRVAGDSTRPADLTTQQLFTAAGVDSPSDPRLAAARIVPARFAPVGKLPNYFGLTIGRVPAMPGVMRYDRDRIVDLTGAG